MKGLNKSCVGRDRSCVADFVMMVLLCVRDGVVKAQRAKGSGMFIYRTQSSCGLQMMGMQFPSATEV